MGQKTYVSNGSGYTPRVDIYIVSGTAKWGAEPISGSHAYSIIAEFNGKKRKVLWEKLIGDSPGNILPYSESGELERITSSIDKRWKPETLFKKLTKDDGSKMHAPHQELTQLLKELKYQLKLIIEHPETQNYKNVTVGRVGQIKFSKLYNFLKID